MSQQKETRVLIKTDLSHVKVWHMAHAIGRMHQPTGKAAEIIRSSPHPRSNLTKDEHQTTSVERQRTQGQSQPSVAQAEEGKTLKGKSARFGGKSHN